MNKISLFITNLLFSEHLNNEKPIINNETILGSKRAETQSEKQKLIIQGQLNILFLERKEKKLEKILKKC